MSLDRRKSCECAVGLARERIGDDEAAHVATSDKASADGMETTYCGPMIVGCFHCHCAHIPR